MSQRRPTGRSEHPAYIEASQPARPQLPPAELEAPQQGLRPRPFVFGRPASGPAVGDRHAVQHVPARGLMHSVRNMLPLDLREQRRVQARAVLYLLAYLATAFAAGFGDILLRPREQHSGGRRSGAISRRLGMYLVWSAPDVRMLLFLPPVSCPVRAPGAVRAPLLHRRGEPPAGGAQGEAGCCPRVAELDERTKARSMRRCCHQSRWEFWKAPQDQADVP